MHFGNDAPSMESHAKRGSGNNATEQRALKFKSEQEQEHRMQIESKFRRKKKAVIIRQIDEKKDEEGKTKDGAKTQATDSPPSKPPNPFESKMVYKYKKFKGRDADYYKHVEKLHNDKKTIDYHRVDYEATQNDIEAIESFKSKRKLPIETFEQLVDIFEKLTKEDETCKPLNYCLEFINLEGINIKLPQIEVINQIYKWWVKKRETEKGPLLRLFKKKPDSSD